MPNRVYRAFTSEDLFSTTIQTETLVVVTSGSEGYTSNTDAGSGSITLYGGVRGRNDVGPDGWTPKVSGYTGSAGVQIYPITDLNTYSIDGVVANPDPYPHTSSIRFFRCYNIPQVPAADLTASDEVWYEEHHSVVRRLSDWYHTNRKTTWQPASTFPDTFTGWHIPQIFYHRQIATGSVVITVNLFINAPVSSTVDTVYWKDDGYGRLWEVTSSATPWQSGTQLSGTVLYNEGIIAFTNPDPAWQSWLAGGMEVVHREPHIQLEFRSVNPVESMVFMCRMGPGEVNASNNPSYYVTGSDGKRWAHNWQTSTECVTYVSAIGLYNEERQLVGVAKLAQPIRKRERDAVDIRLRLDL